MREFSISNREKFRRIDPVILFCVLGMNILSIITLASAADAYGTWYVKVQTFASVVSFMVMLVITFIDYDALFQKLKYAFFAASIILIIIVKIWDTGSNGNENWISIGNVSIQPTELVKVTFMITFALHLDRVKDKINHPLSILQLALHAGLIIGMVLWQGDLGMALVYIAIMAFMLFGAGVSLWYFAGVAGALLAVSPLAWSFLTEKQQMRIIAGFNPELDPLGAGWHALRSRDAIIAGGFRGAGFSGGTQYANLWGGQSDFLFSVLAEKFGFLGTLIYIVLIVTLIIRILFLARQTRKKYAAFLCVGIAGMLIAQAVENIGMCLALLPVVGITLPFFSYGASSILSMYICVGILQSICTHNKKYYFEREKA